MHLDLSLKSGLDTYHDTTQRRQQKILPENAALIYHLRSTEMQKKNSTSFEK